MKGGGKGHRRHQAGQQDEHHPLRAGRGNQIRMVAFAFDLPFPQPPVHAGKQHADAEEREQAPHDAGRQH